MLMNLYTEKMTEDQAKQICTWCYIGEYYIYNCPDWDTITKEDWGMSKQKVRNKEFFSVLDNLGALWGYYRFKEESEKIMIGLGLRPDLCGKGNGAKLMLLIIQDAKQQYRNHKLLLEVRDWNIRAKLCYEKSGFVVTDSYERNTPTGPGQFFLMEYKGQ